MDTPRTLLEAVKFFAVPENCLEYLVARRWPNGVTCPTCGSTGVYFDKSRQGWICKTKHPLRKFSLKTGTIFEDSPLGLDKWFAAMWMIAGAKNGISSYEIHRALGITQKSAWFVLHRIRLAMQTRTFMKIDGEVEVDETYIGAKARNMHASKRKRLGMSQSNSMVGKAAVMGLLERHGKDGHSTIRLQVIEGRKRSHFTPVIEAHVEKGATVNTDAHLSYQGLAQNYIHNVIDHAEAYVNGQIHTNGCENFWSLLKRALRGTYVSVEPFHLFRYLDEQAYRFNTRKGTDSDRFRGVLASVTGRRIQYKDLIAKALPA